MSYGEFSIWVWAEANKKSTIWSLIPCIGPRGAASLRLILRSEVHSELVRALPRAFPYLSKMNTKRITMTNPQLFLPLETFTAITKRIIPISNFRNGIFHVNELVCSNENVSVICRSLLITLVQFVRLNNIADFQSREVLTDSCAINGNCYEYVIGGLLFCVSIKSMNWNLLSRSLC